MSNPARSRKTVLMRPDREQPLSLPFGKVFAEMIGGGNKPVLIDGGSNVSLVNESQTPPPLRPESNSTRRPRRDRCGLGVQGNLCHATRRVSRNDVGCGLPPGAVAFGRNET